MSAHRTIIHDTHSGPGLLRLRLPVGRVTIAAGVEHERATVRLAARDAGDQAAVEAIERAEVTRSGEVLGVTVPPVAGGGRTVVHQGFGRTVVSGNARVITGNGSITVETDGTINTSGFVVTSGSGGIAAEVTVPDGQRVEVDTDSADITSTGYLTALYADTGSGDVRFTDAGTAELTTGSGDINAGRVGRLQARTGSGDITVDGATGSTKLHADTGDVRVHLAAEVPLRARTGSGDITATSFPGIGIDRSGLRTGSGDITVR